NSETEEERKARLPVTTEEEDGLLEAMNQPMDELLSILEFPGDSAYSPDEISRLAFDPFPAPLIIEVPGEILELEGFEREDRHKVFYRGISLWEAYARVEGRWHEPDPVLPVMPYLYGEIDEDEPFDLDSFLSLPRYCTTPPSLQEVQQAVAELLSPQEVYRIRWKTKGSQVGSGSP
ncbi:hypothetical protein ACFLU6_09170, partial [Acidobacteriota bacterium]